MAPAGEAAFPGNGWLAARLVGMGGGTTVAGVHGFFRGVLAGPLAVPFEQALSGLLEERPAPACGRSDSVTTAGLAALWEATARAYRRNGAFPRAIGPHPGTDRGNQREAAEVIELCDAFLDGYELAGGRVEGDEGEGEPGPAPLVEALVDDLDLLLRALDEIDDEIGKEGIVALQTRLIREGVARLEKDMRAVEREERRKGPIPGKPSRRKAAEKKPRKPRG